MLRRPSIAEYLIEDRSLGSSEVHFQANSIHYFCRTCGKIWARIEVSTAEETQVLENACHRHQNRSIYTWGQPPGSIFPTFLLHSSEAMALSALCLSHFPPQVLERELSLELSASTTESEYERNKQPSRP